MLVVCCLASLPVGAAPIAVEATTARQPVTMTFESPAVDRSMAYDVLLPSDYETTSKRYPVLILLHGYGGHHRVWNVAPSMATDLIIVMPDAGNSWYVNWHTNTQPPGESNREQSSAASRDREENWEAYIVTDLIDHVDQEFRTIPSRAGRAIAGFSMGGYGAVTLGLRNTDRFVAIASISGYLDFARSVWKGLERGARAAPRRRERPSNVRQALKQAQSEADLTIAVPGFRSTAERTPAGRPFTTVEAARAHDPYHLVDIANSDQLPSLHLACGTEDSLFGFTRELAESLLARRIPFSHWQARGGHDADFRSRALAQWLPRLRAEMAPAVHGPQASRPMRPPTDHHDKEAAQ